MLILLYLVRGRFLAALKTLSLTDRSLKLILRGLGLSAMAGVSFPILAANFTSSSSTLAFISLNMSPTALLSMVCLSSLALMS